MNVLEQLAESFKEMVKREPPASYVAAGKQVVCGHCVFHGFRPAGPRESGHLVHG